MSDNTILETAIAAHTAGLCPIRAKTDGSKAPYGTWKQYMEDPPGLDDVMTWFRDWPNVGLVCGAVSDRLVMVEFEGRFMEHIEEARDRLRAAELLELFTSWVDGYSETTPGGGVHILIHVGGDGPCPGNIKIASDGTHQTLIETRGEGGFVIIAPSNGSTHPSGGRWSVMRGSLDEIAWVTPEEFAAVLGVLSSFDVPSRAVVPLTRPSVPFRGEGWMDEAVRRFRAENPLADELVAHGWTHTGNDKLGSLWLRPGDTEQHHSARINLNDRFQVFTTSTQFDASKTTYDSLDVRLAYLLGRHPVRSDRTAYLRGERSSPLPSSFPQATGEEVPPSGLWLPPEFWNLTPTLTAIRDAALSSMLSPEGVLGAFLSCYATTIPMSIKLPRIVGAPSPLNLYCALVARSGGGKSTSMAVAMDLLGYGGRNRHVLLNRSLRSGEGLITLAIHAKGDAETGPIYNNAIQVCFDEGGTLAAQASRTGSTTISYLNTAWAGHGVVGGAKASESASFPADLVRVCAVMGVQFGVCANLFTGEAKALGFPQRVLFFGLENPAIGDVEIVPGHQADIEPLDVKFWDHGEFAHNTRRIEVPDHIDVEVKRWTQQRNLGAQMDEFDSHQKLLQLRTASVHALWEGRGALSDLDWEIADAICTTSRTIRSQLVRSIGDVADDRHRAAGRADVVRQEAADTAWLDVRVQRVVGHLLRATAGLSRKEVKSKLASTERPRVDEILEYGIARGLIVNSDDRFWGGKP